jgi:transposase-like protein
MLKKIRSAMAYRDSIYCFVEELIELDDTFVGGKRAGKRGRGAEGKKPVLVAIEHKEQGAGFVATKAVESVSGEEIKNFLRRNLQPSREIRTDAFTAMIVVDEEH